MFNNFKFEISVSSTIFYAEIHSIPAENMLFSTQLLICTQFVNCVGSKKENLA